MQNPHNGDFAVIFDNVSLRRGGVEVLEAVSAKAPRGSSTAIIGPNGAGKTSLLLALLGQLEFAGEIRLVASQGARPPRVGYVPQFLDFDRALPLTVLEFMLLGLQRRPLWLGASPRKAEAALRLLAEVRAERLVRRRLGALSGGELQRVLLALALEREPELLILDEPAAGVDVRGENLLCELLECLRAKLGFTQVMVTHDLAMVTAHATHVICLNHRVMGEGSPQEILTPQVLESTFGLHLGLPKVGANLFGHAPDCACRERADA